MSAESETPAGTVTEIGDWTYTKDDAGKTVTLIKYNGTETSITIPAAFQIDGENYSTVLQGMNEWKRSENTFPVGMVRIVIEKGV